MARKLETIEDLYVDELQDLYHAEQQLAQALPDMARSASSDALRQSLADDAAQTERHVSRLESILKRLGRDPAGHRCKGMEGLLQEGRERMTKEGNAHVLDAGLIVLAQKAQHYEIAGYGSACTFANLLGRPEDAKVLHQSLDEECQTDVAYSRLAKETINTVAAAP